VEKPESCGYEYELLLGAVVAVERARETIRRRGLRTIEGLALHIAHQSGQVARATRGLQVDGISLEGLDRIQEDARDLAALAIQLDVSIQREIRATKKQEEEGGAACVPA